MRGKGCGIGLVLMAALTAACARPTPEPAFWTVPCPNLPPETPPPTPAGLSSFSWLWADEQE
jgi:hypothetical protein